MQAWTAVILTGGRSSRLGRDKAHEPIGGLPMLQRVLGSIPEGIPIVIVGPEPNIVLDRSATVVQEDPPGSGPAAALAAALPLVNTPALVALATDLPFLANVPRALALALACGRTDAVVARDHAGRDQPLCAAYRTDALRRAAAALPSLPNASMRALTTGLSQTSWSSRGDTVDPTMDVDTPADLARAQGAAMMQDWIDAVRFDLGIAGEIDIDEVLDVAKDVAHNVQRPAAPVTTYLLGLAVGAGIPPHEAAAKVRALAAGWIAEQ